MNQNLSDSGKDFFNEQKNIVRISLDEILAKVKTLISKLKESRNENTLLKENIKNLNLKISELKLQLTKINTELINKDKEISDLKNLILNSKDNKIPVKDKDEVKSRIKDLISRIDSHLEQHENGERS
ncbi:MAG: hypothetical protein JNJ56_12435 [Ignavibacteria bacterium]|nr:hypothetical protein [Ignavibacteria bacterium]